MLSPGAYWEPEACGVEEKEPSGTYWLAGISEPDTGDPSGLGLEAGEPWSVDPDAGSEATGPEAPEP